MPYDSIYCEYPLLRPMLQNLEFQTKDLSEGMGSFVIGKPVRIALPFYLLCLKHRRKVRFTGTVTFYTSIPAPSGPDAPWSTSGWAEYRAVFSGGKMVRLRELYFSVDTPKPVSLFPSDDLEQRFENQQTHRCDCGRWER